MLGPLRIFFFIPLLLHMHLARAWQSIDTCQMGFFEMDKDFAWQAIMQLTEFNTDKYGLYDLLVRFRNRDIKVDNKIATEGLTNLNFDIPAESADTPQNGTVFGYSIETKNFMIDGSTNFEAQKTGDYTFSIDASDAAILGIFTDMSPYCCDTMNDPDVATAIFAGVKFMVDLPSDPDHSNQTLTVSMREGVAYPMEFFYVNWSGDAHFTLTVTDPDGETTSDFIGYAGLVTNIECNNIHATSRSYSEWSLDYSTTYSSTIITIDQTTTTTLETVYYVVTPMTEELSVTETSSSNIVASSATESDVSLTSLDTFFITSSLSGESEHTLSSLDDVSTLITTSSINEEASSGIVHSSSSSNHMSTMINTSSFNEETSSRSVSTSRSSEDVSPSITASSSNEETTSVSEYSMSEEYHSSSEISFTQGAWSSSVNSRSAISESPSSTAMDTDDAISRSHEKSTDLTSADSSISVTKTSNQALTTSKTGSVSESVYSIDVTSSLADTMFFGNSSSFTIGDLTTSNNIDDSFTNGGAHTTDVGDEYTSVRHTNTECTKFPTEDNWKISNTNLDSVLTRETGFTVITTDISSTNDNRVSETNKANHPLNTPTSKYGESNDKPNGISNYGPVNTKSLAESLSHIVSDVTQAVPSKSATPVISGSSNSPVVSVYAVESNNLGSRLCFKVICILLPALLLL